MPRKFDNLGKFVLWFAEQYHKVKSIQERQIESSEVRVKYKIACTYEDYQKSGKIVIQAKSSPVYSYLTPQEVYSDVEIMASLHPLDASTITKLHFESNTTSANDLVRIKYTIDRQYYSNDLNELVYLIRDMVSDTVHELSESKLLNNINVLEGLSAKDSMSIGFAMGTDHQKKVSKLIG